MAILPQFCPIFNIGGMNFDHDFFQVSKLSEDQKKKKKMGGFAKHGRLFSPHSREGQRSDADQSQIIGGGAVKLLEGIYPPIPTGFGSPDSTY